MKWGRFGLGLARATRRWAPIATVASRSAVAGTPVELPALDDALVAPDGLVVVAGRSALRAGATVDRALRRALGTRALVVVAHPWDCDLHEVLRLAADHAPVVVLVPDAPLSLLDRVDSDLRALVDARTRLVVTTRVVDAYLAPEVAAILKAVTIRLPDEEGDDGSGGGPDDEGGDLARAIMGAVVDRDRLGVEEPLHFEELYGLVGATPAAVHAELRRLVGAGLVRRDRRYGVEHLAPSPEEVDRAERTRPVPWSFGSALSRRAVRLRVGPRAAAVRIALARGDDEVALGLADGLAPGWLPVAALVRLAQAEEGRGHLVEAAGWFEAAVAHGEGDVAGRGGRGAPPGCARPVRARVTARSNCSPRPGRTRPTASSRTSSGATP